MLRCWLALAVVTGCHISADYSGTNYRCDDGKCPSGYQCINAVCVMPGDGGGPVDTFDGALNGDGVRDWWDVNWPKRAQLTIANPSAGQIDADFPVMVTVDLTTFDPGATTDDPRIVYKDPTTGVWAERSHYVEGPDWWWFDLVQPIGAGASNTTDYWIYFGNPAPPAGTSSGSSVFTLYDSFSATTINTTKWTTLGTPSQTNNNLNLHAGDSVRSNTQYGPGYAVMTAFIAPPTNYRWWGGFQRQTDFTDGDPWLIWIDRASSDSDFPAGYTQGTIWPEASITGVTPAIEYGSPAKPIVAGAEHWYTVQRVSDRIVYKYDEQLVYTYMLPSSFTTPQQVRVTNEGTVQIQVPTIHVRKATWPDPTVAIGTTEYY